MRNQVSSSGLSTPKPSSNGRMESLDGLRGVAALVVVFAHAMIAQSFYWDLRFVNFEAQSSKFEWVLLYSPLRLLYSGDKAVILFFVLSGFVLSIPWMKGRELSYSSFLISRLCRIYLPYCAAMVFAAGFAFLLGGQAIPDASVWINNYAWTNTFSLLNIPSVLMVLGNDYSSWINNPTWSLVWEMRVSFLFPMLVLPVLRWGGLGALAVVAGLWAAFSLGGAMAADFPAVSSMLGQPQKTFYFAGYFIVGIVLARYRESLINFASKNNGLRSMAFLVAGLLIWLVKSTGEIDAFKAVGAALVIVAAISNGLPRQWLTTLPAQWLGRVSYSLYLVHVPMILIAEYLLHKLLPHATIALIAIPASLLVAELFYRVVERPSHELGHHLVSQRAIIAKAEVKAA